MITSAPGRRISSEVGCARIIRHTVTGPFSQLIFRCRANTR
jgi:hypothetical protein